MTENKPLSFLVKQPEPYLKANGAMPAILFYQPQQPTYNGGEGDTTLNVHHSISGYFGDNDHFIQVYFWFRAQQHFCSPARSHLPAHQKTAFCHSAGCHTRYAMVKGKSQTALLDLLSKAAAVSIRQLEQTTSRVELSQARKCQEGWRFGLSGESCTTFTQET